jgi:hypothetical protein
MPYHGLFYVIASEIQIFAGQFFRNQENWLTDFLDVEMTELFR